MPWHTRNACYMAISATIQNGIQYTRRDHWHKHTHTQLSLTLTDTQWHSCWWFELRTIHKQFKACKLIFQTVLSFGIFISQFHNPLFGSSIDCGHPLPVRRASLIMRLSVLANTRVPIKIIHQTVSYSRHEGNIASCCRCWCGAPSRDLDCLLNASATFFTVLLEHRYKVQQ